MASSPFKASTGTRAAPPETSSPANMVPLPFNDVNPQTEVCSRPTIYSSRGAIATPGSFRQASCSSVKLHLSASGRQFRAGVLLQGPPHLQWIAVKPPRLQALRREQVEHVPGELVALAEGNQCQSLGWIEAIDIDGLQLIERLFKFDVGLIEFLDGCGPPDQGLSIGSARAGVQPLDLPD